jgi:hypothetical protein
MAEYFLTPRTNRKNSWIIPKLEDIQIEDKEDKEDRKYLNFKTILNYPAKFKGNPPDIIELQKSIEPAMNNLVTECNCSFEIDYNIRSSKVTYFNRMTFMCGENKCAYKNFVEKKNIALYKFTEFCQEKMVDVMKI